MTDLFKKAGVKIPTQKTAARRARGDHRNEEGSTYGGHNLRDAIPAKDSDGGGSVLRPRPRSTLAKGNPIPPTVKALAPPNEDEAEDEANEDEESDLSSDDDDDDVDDDDDDEDGEQGADDGGGTTQKSQKSASATPTSTTGTTKPPPPTQDPSAVGRAAATIMANPGFNLNRELLWQSAVTGDSTKQKSFRTDVTQQVDLIVFGWMRPSSPYIQLLHSIATYAVRGGDSDCHNKDFGYVGDRTSLRTPTAVVLDDKLWKWVGKKVVLDIVPVELFYANPDNARVLYEPSHDGGTTTTVPRMVYLPPPFATYCAEQQRTPFQLHQFITQYATANGSATDIGKCDMLINWCIVASHRHATPTTSVLAVQMETAPTDDDEFLRWIQRIDKTGGGHTGPPPSRAASTPLVSVAAPQTAAVAAPSTDDMFKRMAESISKSFATAAASLQAPSHDVTGTGSENGGQKYDEFQMAVVMGFAHVDDIAGVPIIWALFQYSNKLDIHKDTLKRRMTEYAMTTTPDRPEQVTIDRSLYITDATMREIIAINFNPGGVSADADTADKGLSILVCRARTAAQRAEIKRYERTKDKSKRNWSKQEAEEDEVTAYDTGALPDDYNELLRCLGTYCALLHTLFGNKCVFYRNCYKLWTEMNSEVVCEKREKFTALFCRQIVWAILEESRAFFAQRLSVDDFDNAQLPEDIPYPTCSLAVVIQSVKYITPIERSTFPSSWYPGNASRAGRIGSVAVPVQSVATPGAAPSVVSGITTAASTRTQRTPAPVAIRATNIHPTIKATMEPYIAKCKGINLTALLNQVNLTIDDLPKLSPEVSGTSGICYNWVLGRCQLENCRHLDGHVNARDVTDEFAADLLGKLRPGITEFMTNGLPQPRRRNRRRRRE